MAHAHEIQAWHPLEGDAHAFTGWLKWLDSALDRIPVLEPLTQEAVETARTQNKDFFSLVEKREKRGMYLKPDVLAALHDLEKVAVLPMEKNVGDLPPALIEHGRWAQARKLDVKEDKLQIDRVLQMFGDGDEAPGPEGHVLLLQLGSGFGLPIELHGGVSQMWITPEDLAAARFESALHVTEMS